MPFFELQLKADFENVVSLEMSVDTEYAVFTKFQCGSCQSETSNFMSVSNQEAMDIFGSRGTANLVFRCKECKREHSVNIHGKPGAYTKSGSFQGVSVIECRGVTPTQWQLTGTFICKTEAGRSFAGTFDDEGNWVDYDDSTDLSLAVYNLVGKWVGIKKPAWVVDK